MRLHHCCSPHYPTLRGQQTTCQETQPVICQISLISTPSLKNSFPHAASFLLHYPPWRGFRSTCTPQTNEHAALKTPIRPQSRHSEPSNDHTSKITRQPSDPKNKNHCVQKQPTPYHKPTQSTIYCFLFSPDLWRPQSLLSTKTYLPAPKLRTGILSEQLGESEQECGPMPLSCAPPIFLEIELMDLINMKWK